MRGRLLWSALVILLVAAVYARAVPAGGGATLYLPVLSHLRGDGLGLHVPAGEIEARLPWLQAIMPQYVRLNWGQQIDPDKTPWKVYEVGGWAAVDAFVLPALEAVRDLPAMPLVTMTRGGLPCREPSLAQLTTYGVFVADFIERYDLQWTEIWNEVDSVGGMASLFGCFGQDQLGLAIHLAQTVRANLAPGHTFCMSFTMWDAADFAMLTGLAPYLDCVGIHHYGIWQDGAVVEPYPGTLAQTYALVDAAVSVPVYLTEVNLRDPADVCSPAFYAAQVEYNIDALGIFPVTVLHALTGKPDWDCTGLNNTPTLDALLPGAGYPGP